MTGEPDLLNCLIVEDEPLALSLLSDYVTKTPGLRLLEATSDPLRGLSIATAGGADLVFLDMQMPELTGIQFLKVLQQRAMVIVTTAYGDYALDGYEYHVVDYLLKPITFERFILAADKARMRKKAQTPELPVTTPVPPTDAGRNYMFVKTDHRMVRLNFGDLHYLEGARDYVLIHTGQGQVLTLESMRSLESRLPNDRFLRIHKSYIVALDKIEFVERGRLAIAGQLLPVSDSYRESLNRHIHSTDYERTHQHAPPGV